MLTPAQYVQLKSELQTDPATLGYATYVASGNDVALRLMLNHPRDGLTVPQANVGGVMTDLGIPGAAITRNRIDISPAELLEAIHGGDLGTATQNTNALRGAMLGAILALRVIPLADQAGTPTRIRTNLDLAIGNTNGSQSRFNALAQRTGSRAEQLFGTGTVVDDADIARALRATP